TAAIDKLLGAPVTATAGLALIAAAGRAEAVGRVRDIAADGNRPMAVRTEAIKTLGEIPSSEAVEATHAFLGTTSEAPLAAAAARRACPRGRPAPRAGATRPAARGGSRRALRATCSAWSATPSRASAAPSGRTFRRSA